MARWQELVVGIGSPADEAEFIHDIDASGHAPKSREEIAAAVAEVDTNANPRRKYSPDDGPGAVHIGPSRTSLFVFALVIAIAEGLGLQAFRKVPVPEPVTNDPITLVAVLSPTAVPDAPEPLQRELAH